MLAQTKFKAQTARDVAGPASSAQALNGLLKLPSMGEQPKDASRMHENNIVYAIEKTLFNIGDQTVERLACIDRV